MKFQLPSIRVLAAYLGLTIVALGALAAIFGRDRAWEALGAVWRAVGGG